MPTGRVSTCATNCPEIIWELGRRNFALRAEAKLAIVGPITDASGWAGTGILDVSLEEAARIMDEDPGVKAGIFTCELHPVRGVSVVKPSLGRELSTRASLR